jgi:anti-sigma regulatory factor (Ser/Thr protein kinase)
MWLLSDKARVMILVWDASPEAPLMLSPEDNEEAGRGLFLVDAISARWDWYPVPNAGGKVVRALVTE